MSLAGASRRAVIFDFDGLVIDTEWPAYVAWCELFEARGASLSLGRWVRCVGTGYSAFDPVDELERLTGRAWDRQALYDAKAARKAALSASLAPLPGVLDRLDEAAALGWKIGLASSSAAPHVRGHLARLGLGERFEAICTGDEVAAVKPDPALYLLAAARLGAAPENCVVFEDSLNGIRAARAAGMYAVAVPNRITAGLDFSSADRRLGSLEEVRLAELG